MAGSMQLRYTPLTVDAGATVEIPGSAIGGFLATTGGTITINKYVNGVAVALITALTVPVGWTPLPFYIGQDGGQVISGTAIGLLAAA